jgi:hypothetical protein
MGSPKGVNPKGELIFLADYFDNRCLSSEHDVVKYNKKTLMAKFLGRT